MIINKKYIIEYIKENFIFYGRIYKIKKYKMPRSCYMTVISDIISTLCLWFAIWTLWIAIGQMNNCAHLHPGINITEILKYNQSVVFNLE